VKYFFLTIVLLAFAAVGFGQTASNEPWPPFSGQRRPDEDSQIVNKMLAKQQTAREKKEYAELLERANAAVKMSNDLARSFEKNKSFSETEKKQLAEYEKLVSKIRDDLGGDDDGETKLIADKDSKSPHDVREGVLYLKRSTESLLNQIQKSTRFSISIVAIETSNSLIRLARFLRLKD
jgi:predicted nuclease with TOPRIM domain